MFRDFSITHVARLSFPDTRWQPVCRALRGEQASSFFIGAYAETILGNLQSRVRGDRVRRRARGAKKRR